MFKKTVLVISFLTLFFTAVPIHTYAVQDSSTGTTQVDPWTAFWNTILSWFGIVQGTDEYWSKPIQIDDADNNSDYNNSNADATTRALTDEDRDVGRGIYLNQLIRKQNNYDNNSYVSSGCNPITLTQMVYYFYTKNEKILYDTSGNLLDYDDSLMTQYKTDISSAANNITPTVDESNQTSDTTGDSGESNTDSTGDNLGSGGNTRGAGGGRSDYNKDYLYQCYYTVYKHSPSVPQGSYQGKSDAAPATSTQLNDSIRTVIPASAQGDDIPTDNTNASNAETIVKDTDKQEKTMLKSMVPNSGQSDDLDSDREYLRDVQAHWLHPDSWEDDLPERSENTPVEDSGSSTGTCNAKASHCRGMSQYGAYGLALSGKNYQEILSFYYGGVKLKTIDTNSYIKVRIDKGDDDCAAGRTISIKFEQYLTALGEMPDSWGKKGFEALKAQVVAARTYAYVRTKGLQNSICNTSNCQVFRCTNMGSKPFLAKAVAATAGQILVDDASDTAFSTEYARTFCGPSKAVFYKNHTIPSVNGITYEQKALVATGKTSTTFCK
jgi:hypothetical protein